MATPTFFPGELPVSANHHFLKSQSGCSNISYTRYENQHLMLCVLINLRFPETWDKRKLQHKSQNSLPTGKVLIFLMKMRVYATKNVSEKNETLNFTIKKATNKNTMSKLDNRNNPNQKTLH
jgi:hypothetical protein